ncbi:MAG: histidine kinase [Oscillospiraceae bacterium]
MSEVLKYTNIALEGWSVLFCLIAVVVLLVGTKIEKKTRNYFIAIFLCLAVDLWANISGLLSKGKIDVFGSVIVRVANFSEYFFGYLLSFILSMYILHIVSGENKNKFTVWKTMVKVVFCLSVLMLTISQFNGMIYFIDGDSMYHRGPLFWLSQLFAIASLLLSFLLIFKCRNRLSTKERIAFAIYICLPIVALVLQLFFYGIYFALLASTVSAIAMLFFIVSDQRDKYYEKEREIVQMRSAIMLSQIQPHFLHNTLVSIAQLCVKDPVLTKETIITFSEYMRENMNSLKQKMPIPFDQEFSHLKTYTQLEQLRFGEALKFEFDIQATEFHLPVLSVQPLVENAVKHGVGMKEERGTILVSTRELPDFFEICIIDDGVGFDPAEVAADDKIHIGIENVRSRLKDLSNGTLTIESEKGKGTKVIIQIPKEIPI